MPCYKNGSLDGLSGEVEVRPKVLCIFVDLVILGAGPAAPKQRSLWTLCRSLGLLGLGALVARIDVGRGNIDGLGHGKGLQPFPRVGLESAVS